MDQEQLNEQHTTRSERRARRREEQRLGNTKKSSAPRMLFWGVGIILVILAFRGVWNAGQKTGQQQAVATPELLEITDRDQVQGSRSAPAVLVEYSDFQCPACAYYYPWVEKLRADFPDTLAIVYRHFPLRSIHRNAEAAARAAEAAGSLGKFWEMYNQLFSNQKTWSSTGDPEKEYFEGYAVSIGLDVDAYRTAYESDAVRDKVSRDEQSGNMLGVNGTPTFFLNGAQIENPRTYDAMKDLIGRTIAAGRQNIPVQ